MVNNQVCSSRQNNEGYYSLEGGEGGCRINVQSAKLKNYIKKSTKNKTYKYMYHCPIKSWNKYMFASGKSKN